MSEACPACARTDAKIGITIRGVYDGILFWMCDRDGARWHRWPDGHHLRAKAEPHVNDTEPYMGAEV